MSICPNKLSETDNEIYHIINAEKKRQHNFIELIASENFVSSAVLEAQGSVLTNKYAEGYFGKSYYNGCEEVDLIVTMLTFSLIPALRLIRQYF